MGGAKVKQAIKSLYYFVEFLALFVYCFIVFFFTLIPFFDLYSNSTDRLYRLLICSIDLCYSPTDDGLSISPKCLGKSKALSFFSIAFPWHHLGPHHSSHDIIVCSLWLLGLNELDTPIVNTT